MTKPQALALMNALEGQRINAIAAMTFQTDGSETWNVELDTTTTYTGAQLSQLATYCQNNALNLTIRVSEMGVI